MTTIPNGSGDLWFLLEIDIARFWLLALKKKLCLIRGSKVLHGRWNVRANKQRSTKTILTGIRFAHTIRETDCKQRLAPLSLPETQIVWPSKFLAMFLAVEHRMAG